MFLRLKLISLVGLFLVSNAILSARIDNSQFSEVSNVSDSLINNALAGQQSVALLPNPKNPAQAISINDPNLVAVVGQDAKLESISIYTLSDGSADKETIYKNLLLIKDGALMMEAGAMSMLKGLAYLCFGAAQFGFGSIIVITIVGKVAIVKTYQISAFTYNNICKFYYDRQESIRAGDYDSSAN